jgi:hypothetical protein
MKIQILSGKYFAFAIQNNRCCLTAKMHKAFIRKETIEKNIDHKQLHCIYSRSRL